MDFIPIKVKKDRKKEDYFAQRPVNMPVLRLEKGVQYVCQPVPAQGELAAHDRLPLGEVEIRWFVAGFEVEVAAFIVFALYAAVSEFHSQFMAFQGPEVGVQHPCVGEGGLRVFLHQLDGERFQAFYLGIGKGFFGFAIRPDIVIGAEEATTVVPQGV